MLDRYPGEVYNEFKLRYPLGVFCTKGKAIMEEKTTECPACSERKKHRTEEEKRALTARLRRVEGQIRGIERMIEQDAYCPDVLVQVSAATNALMSFNRELLACHIRSCVSEDIRAGSEEAIEEFVRVIQKLMR